MIRTCAHDKPVSCYRLRNRRAAVNVALVTWTASALRLQLHALPHRRQHCHPAIFSCTDCMQHARHACMSMALIAACRQQHKHAACSTVCLSDTSVQKQGRGSMPSAATHVNTGLQFDALRNLPYEMHTYRKELLWLVCQDKCDPRAGGTMPATQCKHLLLHVHGGPRWWSPRC